MSNISASGASHLGATPYDQTLQIRHVFMKNIALIAVQYTVSVQVDKEILPFFWMHKWSLFFQVWTAEAKQNMKDLEETSFYKAIHKEQVNEWFCLNFWVSYQ